MSIKLYRSGALCACFLLGLSAVSAAEQGSAEKSATEKKATKPRPAPAPLTLPAGVRETAPGTYSYTDPQGKKWIYRKTPFGLARVPDETKPPTRDEQQTTEKVIAQTHAVADGDSIRFERPGPFGVYRWTKKKTDLTEVEQAVWDRDRAKEPAADSQE
jgi:hypothetical protein